MPIPALTALAANAILLLAMVAVYDLVTAKLRPAKPWRRDAVLGVLLGVIGIAIMSVPYPMANGLRFDARSVLLSATGLFTGPLPTLLAMAMTAAYRAWLGGEGMHMGLATVLNSGLIGLIWHQRRRTRLADLTWAELLALGMAVHVATLIGTLLLPKTLRDQTLDAVLIPVLIILPLTTMVMGLLLRDRLRRNAEVTELRETKARLSLTLAAGGQGTFDVDLRTGQAMVSAEVARMLGHDPVIFEDSYERWTSRLHPDDREATVAALNAHLEGLTEHYIVDYRQQRADGSYHWIRCAGRVVERDAAGQPIRMLGTNTDIDGEKRAAATERLTMAALEAAADAIVITDRAGIIQWCNPAFTELTGYERHEVLGNSPRHLIKSGVQSQAFYESMWSTLLAGQVWRGEVVNRRKDHSRYVEQQTITPVVDDHGVVTNFISIKRDLSAQRQLEAQFHQSQKMESVGRLAGSVAHDFNNLLTVINSSIELAQGTLPKGHPARADLQEAERAGARAVLLTRQLLGFSRQQPARAAVLDLAEVVQGILPMLERLIGENIEIETEVNGTLPPVLIDRGQMEQVVMNLAINGRDAMPGGGILTITMSSTAPATGEAMPWVELAVRDTGTGMDAETQAHLFEPFFTTKEPGKGTGLGLATILGIIRGAGGRIDVDSTLGRGTTFTIRLPGATAPVDEHGPIIAPAESAAQRGASTGGAKPTILVVEDEEAIRRVMRRVLEASGYDVIEAEDGESALAAITRHGGALALMITDMMLPGMTGGELVAQLRQIQPTVPVVLTSGYSADFALERVGIGEGVVFLGKPFALDELVRTVRAVVPRTA